MEGATVKAAQKCIIEPRAVKLLSAVRSTLIIFTREGLDSSIYRDAFRKLYAIRRQIPELITSTEKEILRDRVLEIISQCDNWLIYINLLNLLNALGYDTQDFTCHLDNHFPNSTEKIRQDLGALVKKVNSQHNGIIVFVSSVGCSFTKNTMMFGSDIDCLTVYPVRKYPVACHRVIPNSTNTGSNTPCEFSNGIYYKEGISLEERQLAQAEFASGLCNIGIENWNYVAWREEKQGLSDDDIVIDSRSELEYQQQEELDDRDKTKLRVKLFESWTSLTFTEKDILRRIHGLGVLGNLGCCLFLVGVDKIKVLEGLEVKGLIGLPEKGKIHIRFNVNTLIDYVVVESQKNAPGTRDTQGTDDFFDVRSLAKPGILAGVALSTGINQKPNNPKITEPIKPDISIRSKNAINGVSGEEGVLSAIVVIQIAQTLLGKMIALQSAILQTYYSFSSPFSLGVMIVPNKILPIIAVVIIIFIMADNLTKNSLKKAAAKIIWNDISQMRLRNFRLDNVSKFIKQKITYEVTNVKDILKGRNFGLGKLLIGVISFGFVMNLAANLWANPITAPPAVVSLLSKILAFISNLIPAVSNYSSLPIYILGLMVILLWLFTTAMGEGKECPQQDSSVLYNQLRKTFCSLDWFGSLTDRSLDRLVVGTSMPIRLVVKRIQAVSQSR